MPKGTPARDRRAHQRRRAEGDAGSRKSPSGSPKSAPTFRRRISAAPQALGHLVNSEIDKWVPLIKAAGVSAVIAIAVKLERRRTGDARGRVRSAAAMGDRASDQGRRLSRRATISFRSARLTSWPTRNCSARPASNGSNAGRRCRPNSAHVRIPTITDPRGTDFAPPRGSSSSPGCSIWSAAPSPPSKRSAC